MTSSSGDVLGLLRAAGAQKGGAAGAARPAGGPSAGEVIAVGPGKLTDKGSRTALAVKVGDTVLFGKYSGSDVEVNGKEYKILREGEILGKVTK